MTKTRKKVIFIKKTVRQNTVFIFLSIVNIKTNLNFGKKITPAVKQVLFYLI